MEELNKQSLRDFLRRTIEKINKNKGKNLSEEDTKEIFITPLLKHLGWDTDEPDEVKREYQAAGGRCDYALMVGGQPLVFIDPKRLTYPLTAQDAEQVVIYGTKMGVRWCVITNGSEIMLYDYRIEKPISEKLVFKLKIEDLERF